MGHTKMPTFPSLGPRGPGSVEQVCLSFGSLTVDCESEKLRLCPIVYKEISDKSENLSLFPGNSKDCESVKWYDAELASVDIS